MKRFKQYIQEGSFTFAGKTRSGLNIIRIINNKGILLDDYFKEIIKPPQRDEYYHITSYKGLKHILDKVVGRKKSLSVSSQKPDRVWIVAGVTSAFGGVLLTVDGDPVVETGTDLFSWPDSSGRRWMRLTDEIPVSYPSGSNEDVLDMTSILKKQVDEYNFSNKMGKLREKMHDIIWKEMKEIKDKLLRLNRTDFINNIPEFIETNVPGSIAKFDYYFRNARENIKDIKMVAYVEKTWNKKLRKITDTYIKMLREFYKKNSKELNNMFNSDLNDNWTDVSETILRNVKPKKIEIIVNDKHATSGHNEDLKKGLTDIFVIGTPDSHEANSVIEFVQSLLKNGFNEKNITITGTNVLGKNRLYYLIKEMGKNKKIQQVVFKMKDMTDEDFEKFKK